MSKRQHVPPQTTEYLTMNETANNDDKYLEVLRTLDPELYLIKMALEETGVNAQIIPRVIRVLGNLEIGTGFGEVVILMKSGVVTQIKANESDVLNMEVRG